MRPIADINDVRAGTVLYHSAFGFARVSGLEPERVALDWEATGDNLPLRVSFEVLQRVYAMCADDGFFHRAVHDADGLRELLQTHPLDALALLLADLHGAQDRRDLREWIVGRGLMSDEAFRRWWEGVLRALPEDARFVLEGEALSLRTEAEARGPRARLENPLLPPGRRLDLALTHRAELDDDFFFQQLLLAWRTGGTQVRELALAALRDRPAVDILGGLLEGGPDNLEALIHAIRRAGWSPDEVDEYTHQMLIERVLQGLETGGPLDNEGRLAATLTRWPSPGAREALFETLDTTDGRRLVRATFAALPPRRAEALALDLLEMALEHDDSDSAQWLAGEALGFALVDSVGMARRLEDERPAVARWYRTSFRPVESKLTPSDFEDLSDDDTAHTAELDLSDIVTSPVALADLAPRSGASLLGLGLALARAMTPHHKEGRVVNPGRRTVLVLPDETMEVHPQAEPAPGDPQPLLEDPSLASDVYAASVLLLEALLGRPWPRDIPAHRAIPYLRTCIPLLPPSALAPLDAGLHPDPRQRPPSALAWLASWQSAAVAEETRGYAAHRPDARLHLGYDSHVGRLKLLLTQTNQDALYVSTKGPLSLLVVCDGISTANAGSGDIASSIASHVIANLWEQALPRLQNAGTAEIRDFLDRALRMANTAVCEAALRYAGGNLDGRVPMGTTIVLTLVQGNVVHLAWLGDSRAYLVGPYGASLLTADENQAGERLKAWHLDLVDRWDPAGYALVGYLGHFNELTRPEALPAHHLSFVLNEGERLVLCSDGITDYIGETHPEVAYELLRHARHPDPEEAARELVNAANRGGGGDNCTAVVASLWTV